MKNIIWKAYCFLGGEGRGDRGQRLHNNGFVPCSTGVKVSLLLYDEFKAKKIVVLQYKYNIMLTILFNINSIIQHQLKSRKPYP